VVQRFLFIVMLLLHCIVHTVHAGITDLLLGSVDASVAASVNLDNKPVACPNVPTEKIAAVIKRRMHETETYKTLRINIEYLPGFPMAVYQGFRKAGKKYISHIVLMSRDDILKIDGMDAAFLQQLEYILRQFSLAVSMTKKQLDKMIEHEVKELIAFEKKCATNDDGPLPKPPKKRPFPLELGSLEGISPKQKAKQLIDMLNALNMKTQDIFPALFSGVIQKLNQANKKYVADITHDLLHFNYMVNSKYIDCERPFSDMLRMYMKYYMSHFGHIWWIDLPSEMASIGLSIASYEDRQAMIQKLKEIL